MHPWVYEWLWCCLWMTPVAIPLWFTLWAIEKWNLGYIPETNDDELDDSL